ncbi:hypothetical protein ACJ73_06394 [Blastomyces percursus]|uniref:Nephrocystin 3-like N-terminal domain-containing protein n=1 Tax=Blastomyces percursus TaxID=1658174 RepID=A0A1J9Q162_9EURO|nr:hypothetical protein ACJ73_06394 [Blastomyces percursus]
MNAITRDDEAVNGLEFISELLVRCKVREDILRTRFREPIQGLQSQSESKILGELRSAIKARTVQLYSDILQYQIQLAIHYDHGCFRHDRNTIANGFNNLKESVEKSLSSLKKIEQDIERRSNALHDYKCIFWLKGMPGTEKSTIARTIAGKLASEGRLGGSFFFSKRPVNLTNAAQLFTTLSSQLSEVLPGLRPHVCAAFEKRGDIAGKSLSEQWEPLIFQPLVSLDDTLREGLYPPSVLVFVIDALDECEGDGGVKECLLQDDARFAERVCLQIQSLVSQLHQRGDCQPSLLGAQLWQLANGIRHIAEQYARDHISYSLPDTDYTDKLWISNFSPTLSTNDGRPPLLIDEPGPWTSVRPSCLDTTCAPSDVMPPPFIPAEDRYEPGNAVSPDPLAMHSAEERDEVPTTQDHIPEQLEAPGVSSSNYVQTALRPRSESALTSKMARNSAERTAASVLAALPSKPKRSSLDSGADGKASRPRKRRPKPSAKANQSTDMFELCTELEPISNKIFEPDEVYRVLVRLSETKYHQKVPFLVRLFFAVASPLAFKQLAEACEAARERHDMIAPISADDDAMLMKVLDALDSGVTIRAILRRFFLVQLLNCRLRREDDHKNRRSIRVAALQSRGGLTKDTGFSGRADSSAFRDLLTTFYPHLEVPDRRNPSADDSEYLEKHTKLKNRLNAARNWYQLQQKFSPGILALVPCGELRIGTDKFVATVDLVLHLGLLTFTRFEKLPSKLFTIFLDVLCEYRGAFLQEVSHLTQNIENILYGHDIGVRYGFERTDRTSLLQEPMDSQRIIGFCQPFDVSDQAEN